ncbi:hypothetical protein E2C01_085549 [Portunus trituberculatus]|uniref:Uncharacterized protein n=1 Tax=Portunus trituberculatus TaxID=210409 RepID=A0A5B7J970_PORTR|nr:hypothetical protein [Portunus trituberculatus]
MSNRSMSIPRGEPEIHVIQLHKSNNGMGLSIVATKVSTHTACPVSCRCLVLLIRPLLKQLSVSTLMKFHEVA